MRNRRWLIPLVAIGVLVLWRSLRRGACSELYANLETFSAPSARFYDAFASLLFGGFYDKVARQVADRCPAGLVLDVGSGTGNLAVRLAEIASQLMVTGVDVSADMIDRARARAGRSGVGDRVRFEMGDVGQLPYADGYFDLVVSTLSLHHWPDPVRGLAEVHRVLKPGGQACIYDLSDRVLRVLHHGRGIVYKHWHDLGRSGALHHERGIEWAVEASPFHDRTTDVFRWPWSMPAMRRMCLRRGD